MALLLVGLALETIAAVADPWGKRPAWCCLFAMGFVLVMVALFRGAP